MKLPKDLNGDGRKTVSPQFDSYEVAVTPIEVGLKNCKRIIDAFLARGESCHNVPMTTGWVVEEYCRMNGLPYEVETKEHDGKVKFVTYRLVK